jgi:hypothetical protein
MESAGIVPSKPNTGAKTKLPPAVVRSCDSGRVLSAIIPRTGKRSAADRAQSVLYCTLSGSLEDSLNPYTAHQTRAEILPN